MMPSDSDRLDRQRREKQSKRNRGLPGWSSGPASAGRRLTGLELEARARDLGAVVSEPCKVSHRAEIAAVGQPPLPKASRHRQLPAWLKIRMRAQRRLFDIDRPERAAKKPESVKDALMMSARAAVKREIADYMAERGDYHASWERAEADEMDEAAGEFLDIGSHTLHVTGPVKPGNGGEMLVVTSELQADVPAWSTPCARSPACLLPRHLKAG